MKKIIIIVLCVAVTAVGIGVVLKTQKAGLAIENVLPQGPLVYMRLNDVEKNLKEMAAMPFWKAIGNINYDFLVRQNIISPQQATFINLFRTQLAEVLTSPVSKKMFGQEVALAIYPLQKDVGGLATELKTMDPQMIEDLLSGVFLVTRVDPDVQFAEFITRSLKQIGANVTQGQAEYKEETIRTVFVSGTPIRFAFVRLKDLLIVGIGESAARTSIDVYKQSGLSLAKDPQFAQARLSFLDPASSVGFVDFKAFVELLKGQMESLVGLGGEGAQEGMKEMFQQMAGFETITFSSQLSPVVKFNSDVLFDPKKLDPKYAALYTCPAQANKTIDFVPKEVLGYLWSNCLDLNYYWQEIKSEAMQQGAPSSRLDEFEAQIGLSIENDILSAFGDEFGGYLSDIEVGGLFPIPKLLLFARIADQSKAQKLLDKLQEQPIAIFQEEAYQGIAIKYLALPLGEALQPGYCFLGDYLLVATSRQLVKNSIDASKNASLSLVANPAFKEINLGLTDKNRNVQFMKIGDIIEKAKGIIRWSNEWVTARDQKAQAFQAGSQKPLEEVEAGIALKTSELEQMHSQITSLEDEIWDLDLKGQDASAQKTKIEEFKTQIQAKELEITGDYERKAELEKILEENIASAPDPELRESFLNELIFPVLDGLKSIESYGLRVTTDKDALKSSLFLKMAD